MKKIKITINIEDYDLKIESSIETRRRFNRWTHYLINEIAKSEGLPTDIIKDDLRIFLIKRKLIKSSCSELDLTGFASAIFWLSSRLL